VSLLTDVSVRATVEDFAKARDETLKLLEDGYRLIEMAKERSEAFVRYGFPPEVQPRLGIGAAKREIDQRWWRYCFQFTGLAQLMDKQATDEFNATLNKDCPEFTLDNIQTMALTMYQQKEELFLRGIFNVFRQLDRSYRTNDKQRFAVQKKVIVTWLFDTWYTGQGKMVVNHHKRALINDLDRCICTLMKQPYQEYSLEAAIQAQMKEGDTFENEFIRLRGFKNGNGHLWFLNETLLDKINQCIAEYCGPAIPDGKVKDAA